MATGKNTASAPAAPAAAAVTTPIDFSTYSATFTTKTDELLLLLKDVYHPGSHAAIAATAAYREALYLALKAIDEVK